MHLVVFLLVAAHIVAGMPLCLWQPSFAGSSSAAHWRALDATWEEPVSTRFGGGTLEVRVARLEMKMANVTALLDHLRIRIRDQNAQLSELAEHSRRNKLRVQELEAMVQAWHRNRTLQIDELKARDAREHAERKHELRRFDVQLADWRRNHTFEIEGLKARMANLHAVVAARRARNSTATIAE